jgi:preprotein translocase subunit SecD
LRDVIERRVNLFGVGEPVVQVEKGGLVGDVQNQRLIVELPGINNIDQAVALIGKTPSLEFKLFNESFNYQTISEGADLSAAFVDTGLSGRMVKRASLQFDNSQGGFSGEPVVQLEFNTDGEKLFQKITGENIGKPLAIILDGEMISYPVINSEISGGSAVITGNFTPDEAKTLVRDLNFGALPVPIELIGTESVGPTLGSKTTEAGVRAGVLGTLLVAVFLVLWYRLPGLVSVLALMIYIVLMLAIFKLIPVTLTAAGIAGFIMSIGMAVDANILIFERIKEEIDGGAREMDEAVKNGFHRAWLSIRDSNISSMITAVILFWMGTSLVKGFALTFGIGVLVSMLTAISISRTFLFAVVPKNFNRFFGIGFK